MIDTEILEEFISYILFSSYIKNDKPVSLLISAKPESGKTASVAKFKQNDGVVFISDMTYTGLVNLLPRFETKELRTLLIPDMLKLLSRKSQYSANLVTLMSEFIEEGIAGMYTYKTYLKFTNPVRGNFIACITSDDMMNNIGYWGKVGFISRIVPFSYGYSDETVLKIFDYIVSGKHAGEKPIKLKLPKKEKDITLTEATAKELVPLSLQMSAKEQIFGFRVQKNLQTLAKACAMYYKEDKVTIEHINKIKHMSNWMNLKFYPLTE